jgi:hypothetical protein
MAKNIHDALSSWKRKISKRVFYPRMSRKLVSRSTIRSWEEKTGKQWSMNGEDGGEDMTQETLERIYHETGIEVDGDCEIRQKWYKSGVTPRTYFAQGGTSYKLSKYIQEIAGLLTEELDACHPVSRLHPARVNLREGEYLRIYDLSSFTSNHSECKYFVDALSQWCMGTEITLFDSVDGLVQVDLGILLSTYNQMNFLPAYSLEMIKDLFGDCMLAFHNRAGFLGIYGNINFSTFLHAASLLMVLLELDRANVAGDDAHYAETSGCEHMADIVIEANGILEHTKTFRTDEIGAVCLKRGIVQIDTKCFQSIMAIFPSFANLGKLFGYFPPQFQERPTNKKDRLKLIGAEVYRFLQSIFMCDVIDHLDVVHGLLCALYRSASLPITGLLPPYHDMLVPVIPEEPLQLTLISPIEALLQNHFCGFAVVPAIVEVDEVDPSEYFHISYNDEWFGAKTKYLKHLEVLGYVVSEQVDELVYGIEAWNKLTDMYAGNLRVRYSFKCIRDVPPDLWLS